MVGQRPQEDRQNRGKTIAALCTNATGFILTFSWRNCLETIHTVVIAFWCLQMKNKLEPLSLVYILAITKHSHLHALLRCK